MKNERSTSNENGNIKLSEEDYHDWKKTREEHGKKLNCGLHNLMKLMEEN